MEVYSSLVHEELMTSQSGWRVGKQFVGPFSVSRHSTSSPLSISDQSSNTTVLSKTLPSWLHWVVAT